jgi:hypothetical protein
MCYTILIPQKCKGQNVSGILIKNFDEQVKDSNDEGMNISPGQLPCI